MAEIFEIHLEDHSEEVLRALQNAIERALMAMGDTAVNHAAQNLNRQHAVDTGRLKGSIKRAIRGEDVYIGTNVEYAPYIEFGTGHYSTTGGGTLKKSWVYKDAFGNWHRAYPRPARPYLKPAVTDHADEYWSLLEESLKNA